MAAMSMDIRSAYVQAMTRRHFFGRAGFSVGAMALSAMMGRSAQGSPSLGFRGPHFAPRAKRVIYLHMAGSPSQLDLFDDKPVLRKHDGQPCPKELLEGKRFAFLKGVPFMLGSPFQFMRHGAGGAELSQLWR